MDAATQLPVVYIVDDDESVLRALARLVRAGGYLAKPYATPELFLHEFAAESPACILLDMTMPQLTGLQVQAELNERRIKTPVITLTARDDEGARLKTRELGARFILRKPVEDKALLQTIAWVIASQYGNLPGLHQVPP
jgi:FixJ family two-component response regulator